MADFSNHMDGGSYGNAENWDDNAKALGYLVDDVPAVGAVAQTDDGRVGHVAWVEAVGDGTVTVEEYNYAVAGGYDVRTVPTSDFRYLHLADLAPAPSLGATRAATSTLDAQGRTWWARSTSAGDLFVGGPVRHAIRIGSVGSWTPDATPALTTDAQGPDLARGRQPDRRPAHRPHLARPRLDATAQPRWWLVDDRVSEPRRRRRRPPAPDRGHGHRHARRATDHRPALAPRRADGAAGLVGHPHLPCPRHRC